MNNKESNHTDIESDRVVLIVVLLIVIDCYNRENEKEYNFHVNVSCYCDKLKVIVL